MEAREEKPDSCLDIVVVGGCFCDLLTYIARYPRPGETIHGEKFIFDFGGIGANMCIMSAKLGGRNAMVSMIGNDAFGRETIENFKKFGVNTEWISVCNEAATGITNSIVDNNGEPSYISIAGANKLLTIEHVHLAKIIIEKGKVLITNCGIPLSTSLEALKLGRACGLITIFSPAPMVTELDGEFYTNTDILVLNMNEAANLTCTSVTNKDEVMSACAWFHNCGVHNVVITMREQGAMGSVSDLPKDAEMKLSLKNTVFYVAARPANAVDTTGAGDALAGSLAYFIACYPNLTFKEMVTRAVAISTQTVETEGVQKSYPNRDCLPAELFS